MNKEQRREVLTLMSLLGIMVGISLKILQVKIEGKFTLFLFHFLAKSKRKIISGRDMYRKTLMNPRKTLIKRKKLLSVDLKRQERMERESKLKNL